MIIRISTYYHPLIIICIILSMCNYFDIIYTLIWSLVFHQTKTPTRSTAWWGSADNDTPGQADKPCPRNDVHSYWCVARDFPYEWGQLVRQFNDLDDEFATMGGQEESSNAPSALRLISFLVLPAHSCELCGRTFRSEWQLANHKWSKHKLRCNIREFVSDISRCPVCCTEFFSRARLLKHLLDKRVRSSIRGALCRAWFLRRSLKSVPPERLIELDARDAAAVKTSRRQGHTNLVVDRPCQKQGPSILKRRLVPLDSARPRKRLRVKTRPYET